MRQPWSNQKKHDFTELSYFECPTSKLYNKSELADKFVAMGGELRNEYTFNRLER